MIICISVFILYCFSIYCHSLILNIATLFVAVLFLVKRKLLVFEKSNVILFLIMLIFPIVNCCTCSIDTLFPTINTVLVEEALFRCDLIKDKTTKTMLISSIIFGLLHVVNGVNIIQIIIAFAYGYLLCRIQKEGILWSVILHFLVNITSGDMLKEGSYFLYYIIAILYLGLVVYDVKTKRVYCDYFNEEKLGIYQIKHNIVVVIVLKELRHYQQ